jgi:ribonuclease P protein component
MDNVNGLPKQERLCSLHAVRRLFADGVSGFVYPFRYTTYIEKSTTTSVEVLFSVPKRNHKRANKRNLLRRRTKEAYRLHKQPLWQRAEMQGVAVDLSLVFSSKEVLSYKAIEHAINKIIDEVAQRC